MTVIDSLSLPQIDPKVAFPRRAHPKVRQKKKKKMSPIILKLHFHIDPELYFFSVLYFS